MPLVVSNRCIRCLTCAATPQQPADATDGDFISQQPLNFLVLAGELLAL